MMLYDQIIDELNRIPERKMAEVYDLLHYFRLGLEREREERVVAAGGKDIIDRLMEHPVRVARAKPPTREELHER